MLQKEFRDANILGRPLSPADAHAYSKSMEWVKFPYAEEKAQRMSGKARSIKNPSGSFKLPQKSVSWFGGAGNVQALEDMSRAEKRGRVEAFAGTRSTEEIYELQDTEDDLELMRRYDVNMGDRSAEEDEPGPSDSVTDGTYP